MEPTRGEAIVVSAATDPPLRQQLSTLFGGYRAEWLGGKLFELFTAPDYLPELLTDRPCFLIGGRGTGKTTVLRNLSYEGRAAQGAGAGNPEDWNYFGFYYRVNTNRIAAFRGPELSDAQWGRVFAHYINLTLCEELLRFAVWYEAAHGPLQSTVKALGLVSTSLHLDEATAFDELYSSVQSSRVKFEAYINNVGDHGSPPLSLLGQPLDLLTSALHACAALEGKRFFFLIDEYENLADYQQVLFNTLIKHSGDLYTFKIGVKALGFRRHTTLNAHEQLMSPADYERIDIHERLAGGTFADFASRICLDRLKLIKGLPTVITDVGKAFPGMSESEEAGLLGIGDHVRSIRRELAAKVTGQELAAFDSLTPLMAYLILFWARGHDCDVSDTLREALSDPAHWHSRLDNYQHAMLFTLRRGKRGIRKYYCGWDSLVRIADGNIRYLLQLVAESYLRHIEQEHDLTTPVDFASQTYAAQGVGQRYLSELEGLSVDGAYLTRLVLGLGRVFQVFALQAEGHAPEINQMAVRDLPVALDPDAEDEVHDVAAAKILRAAVMHQAIVRGVGTKLPGSSGDTKDYEYSLHPIFAPFFEFSYRRKRRLLVSSADITGLVERPRQAISAILLRAGRTPSTPLSEQLSLFASFYDASA